MVVLAGGVALYATNVYLATSLLPSAVAEIGGQRLYAWNTTVFLLASVGSSVLLSRLLRRDAWCYGIPGISRSVALAGQAVGDPALTEAAKTAITSLTTRPSCQWDVEGPTLCHGYAGALQSTATNRAAKAVIDLVDPDQRFGFQNIENQIAKDEPGFLIGAAGVALALADYGDLPAHDVPARWDALLLLS